MGRGRALHVALGQGSLLKAHRGLSGLAGREQWVRAWPGRDVGQGGSRLLGPGLELFVNLAPLPEGQGRPHASL